MKRIILIFSAALTLITVGCVKTDITEKTEQYVSEIRINFETDTRVSTAHSSSGLKFAWEDGDVIEIWEDLNTEAMRKLFTYDAATQTFKPQSNDDKLEIGKKYFVVNTSGWYFIDVTDGKSSIPMTLKGGTGINNVPMISDVFEATAENTIATMHHIVGIVEIPVKASADGKQLQRVGLDSKAANQALRGDFNITPEAPYTLTSTYGYFDNYNQNASDSPIDLSTSEVKSMFVPAFPGTYSTIDVKYQLVGESEKTIKTGHQLVVERGKITKISEMTLE